MNIIPALKQQKILILLVVALICIIFLGSWIVSRKSEAPATTFLTSSTETIIPPSTPPRTIDFVLRSTLITPTLIHYTMELGKNTEALKSLGFKLSINGAKAVTSENKSFSSSSSLSSQGWQTAVNSSTESSSGDSTINVAMLHITPDNTGTTGDFTLGEFTIELAQPGKLPDFSLDENLSEAYTAAGEKLQARLVIGKPLIK